MRWGIANRFLLVGTAFFVISACAILTSSWRCKPQCVLPRTRSEITSLALAAEEFRMRFGEYPPDASDPEGTKRLISQAFPRYHGGLPARYSRLDAASSLVFWLGGVTDEHGIPIGFSSDRSNPFDNKSEMRIGPVFHFDQSRLRTEDDLLVYLPPNDYSASDPYVYFRANTKGEYTGAWNKCQPCRDSRTGDWINPKSFQLFAPGRDGKYGKGARYPAGDDYDHERQDDEANFSHGTLGDDAPQ